MGVVGGQGAGEEGGGGAVEGVPVAVDAVGGGGGGVEVGGGAVEGVPVAVIAAGGAGVGVAEGVLDVLQRCAEGEGLGGEGVPQAVWGDRVRGLDAGGLLGQRVGG